VTVAGVPSNSVNLTITSSGSTVAVPSASPAAGTYSSPQTVALSDATSGAVICYTTDGSTPTATTPGTCTHGTTYSGSIPVTTSATIKALGTLSGYTNSGQLTSAYIIAAASIVICPNDGEVGDYANCAPSPTLTFGNQGTSTSSMAIPISINNCQSSYIAACGTASSSVTISSIAIGVPGKICTRANDRDWDKGVGNGERKEA
jgi:hypothetical protein